MPLPQLLYAQVIKTVCRWRLVRVTHRVVFGILETVEQVLAVYGWQINTAFVGRVNRFCRNFYLRRFEVSSSSLSNRA
jgi:hypothetical protein